MQEFYTIKRLCLELKISRMTLDNWRKMGLPTIKIGGRVFFDLEDVLKWMKEHKQ